MSLDIAKLTHNRRIANEIRDALVSVDQLGDNVVVVNPAQKCLVVLQYLLDCASPGNTATWQDSDGVLKSGPMPFSAWGGLVAPFSDCGWFALDPGKSLILNLSAAAQVSGHLSYVLI